MRRLFARFSGPEASNRSPSSADSITTMPGFKFSVHTTPINRHFQSRSALGKSAKERCPQNRYRDLNPHSPKDALSSGAAFEIQIIAIGSLPWIGGLRSAQRGE